jgi:hypothetical protein
VITTGGPPREDSRGSARTPVPQVAADMVHGPPGYYSAHQRLRGIRADAHGLLQNRSRHLPPNLRLKAVYRRREPGRGRIGEPDNRAATLA